MDALHALLAQQRARAQIRKQRHRAKQAKDKGQEVVHTTQENLQRAAVGLIGRDFLYDLNKLLEARTARLGLIWKGSLISAFLIEEGKDPEIIQTSNPRTRDLTLHKGGELNARLSALLDQHQVELTIHWLKDGPHLQVGSHQVNDRFVLNIIKGKRGFKIFYNPENLT